MENTPVVDEVAVPKKNVLFEVTPASRVLAGVLFIVLPFIGGWIGYNYAPEKNVLVETIVNKNIDKDESFVAEDPTYMIESGKIIIDLKHKTFEATLMFGLGDVITVNGEYTQQENILTDVLQAVRNSGRNAGYVDENRIEYVEVENYVNPEPKTTKQIVNTIYTVERDQSNLCTIDTTQRLVRSIANQDGTRATTTLFTNLISELQSAGIQTNSKQEWNILSDSDRGDFIFLYANSPCAEKMTMSGPTVSLNLKSNTFMLLTTPFLEFHWLEPWVVSPDGTKIAAVTIGFPSEDIGTVRIIDLIEDKVTDLARAPEGTSLASWCEMTCAHYHLEWIDNDTIEYGIYKLGYTEETKLPIEIRKVNLP